MFFSIFFNFLMSMFDILEYSLINQIDLFAPLLKPDAPEPKKSSKLGI